MRYLKENLGDWLLEGQYDARFESVVEEFKQNFIRRHEMGASCVVMVEGEIVLDVWGGVCPSSKEPWLRDTVCTVFSSTKGATAICAHLLKDRNLLDFEAPVKKYWPEFAKNGKETALVKMALDHSIGVPHYREPVPKGGFYDYEYMVRRTEDEDAFWEPGTRNGYHAISMAWIVGEIVNRAGSKRLGKLFNAEVADFLEADFSIGDAERTTGRVSAVALADAEDAWLSSKFMEAAGKKDLSPTSLFMRDFGLLEVNKTICHQAEVGSANGLSNARGLATIYSPLANGGKHKGSQFISKSAVAEMSTLSTISAEDHTLLVPTRFGPGFMLSTDNRKLEKSPNSSAILGRRAFGHVGAGGSIGFADPDCRMSFGYVMNKMGVGLMLNQRGQSLVDAAYQSLGLSTTDSGYWE